MKIDINKAAVSELTKLNGIGEQKARRIINYRKKNKCFNEKEELMNVKGIGRRVYLELKKDIKITDKVQIDFNPDQYNLGDISEVHLVGDMNDWDPADKQYSLQKTKDGLWTGKFDLKPGTEYKFMYDSESWESGQDIGSDNGQNLIVV